MGESPGKARNRTDETPCYALEKEEAKKNKLDNGIRSGTVRRTRAQPRLGFRVARCEQQLRSGRDEGSSVSHRGKEVGAKVGVKVEADYAT